MNKGRGFTLIELIVVVAVVAILAAIALPSYLSQVRHSRRSEVEGAMQSAALAEERVRADCPTYATSFTATPTGCTSAATMGGNPYTSSYYTVTVTGASATGYTINAAPVGNQANDSAFGTSCGTLTYVLAAGVITKSPTACWTQ